MARNNGLTERARKAGITYDALKGRLRRGWSMHEALSMPVKRHGVKRNISRLIRESGLRSGTVYNRILYGWTVDRALSTPARKYERH